MTHAAIADFPEASFPWPENDGHKDMLHAGRETMAQLRCAILMLARDAAAHLPATMARVERLAGMFQSAAAFVYENDSMDETPSLLATWHPGNMPVVLGSERRNRRKWPMVRHPERGADMAVYRNTCRQMAMTALAGSLRPDVAIVLDSDLRGGWSYDGIASTFSRWGEWDAVASSGLRNDGGQWVQADAWALRYRTWDAHSWPSVRGFAPARGEDWLRVFSAFGGLAVYRWKGYADPGVEYAGGDCEHVTFHKAMHAAGYDRIFLNPSQLVIYGW